MIKGKHRAKKDQDASPPHSSTNQYISTVPHVANESEAHDDGN